MPITIVLADSRRIMREGLHSLIASQPDMKVIAEAEDGKTAVHLVRELSPDLVVMDLVLPNLSGIEATKLIVGEGGRTRVIAMSSRDDRQLVLDALRAGVSAYLPKEASFDELASAFRTVASGGTYLSPSIAAMIVDDLKREESSSKVGPGLSPLTPRERQVLRLLAAGNSTRHVADTLGVSLKTVEAHRRQLMRKLNVANVAQLVKYAIRHGLTTLE